MEAAQGGGGGSDGGGGGGAEVRRLHIVYFLSRKGRIEHPHLVRVHHLSRNGVRLRDIKRWLGELRGKDMPESFSWSYKRRYKTGYVWQDLMDDDLITPISDNEYVLKGSEISSIIINNIKEENQKASSKEEENNHSHSSETSIYVSTKSCEIEEESPTSFGSETSTLTDDSGKIEKDKHEDPSLEEKTQRSSNFYSALLSKKKKEKKRSSSTKKVNINEKVTSIAEDREGAVTDSSEEPRLSKSKSSSNGGSSIFRNLITCGAVETNDSAVVAVNNNNKQSNNKKALLNMCSNDLENVYSAEVCKSDRMGGSQRVFGTPNWTQQKWGARKSCDGVKGPGKSKSESKEKTATCAANYKQLNWPNCSQCGKPFNPEKLHSHMRSCEFMKALSKANAAGKEIKITITKD
ncbi:hypothetical protein ABFS83_02G129600 [Erythranthe nasuta]